MIVLPQLYPRPSTVCTITTKKVTLATGIVERVGIGESFTFSRPVSAARRSRSTTTAPTTRTPSSSSSTTLLGPKVGVLDDLISAVGHRVVHGGEKFKIRHHQRRLPRHIQGSLQLGPSSQSAQRSGHRTNHGRPSVHSPPAIMDGLAPSHAGPRPACTPCPTSGTRSTASAATAPRHIVSLRGQAGRPAAGQGSFKTNLICLHIGNGVAANAIKNGVSYDASMGLTPLEGLVMGTRAGDHDAAIDLMMMEKENIAPAKMNDLPNKKSGLLGITGKAHRPPRCPESGRSRRGSGRPGHRIRSYRIKKYIGAYLAAIGRADAIVFTAGVGEMSDLIQEKSRRPRIPRHQAGQGEKQAGQNEKRRNRDFGRRLQGQDFRHPPDEERVFIEDIIAPAPGDVRRTHPVHLPVPASRLRQFPAERGFAADCAKKPGLDKIQVKPKK